MLGIVVVSYGSADLLRTHLAAVDRSAMTTPSVVVVVDNFRSDADRADVRAIAAEHRWELVANETNAGFGAAANQGARRALDLGCSAVLMLNPDAHADGALLDALAQEVARNPRSLVCPRIVRPDGTPWFTGGRLDLERGWTRNVASSGEPQDEGWLTGACLAASADLWRELGGFDEDYFLYWEDVDLSYRCTVAGGTLLVRPDLEAVHDVGGTQGAGKSAVYYYYNTRNRLLFAAKHLPATTVRRWLLRTPSYGKAVLLRGGRRQLLRSPLVAWPVVRGSAAGVAAAARAALALRPRSRVTDAGRARPVLVAHPSADRYGSDRMVLESVGALVDAGRRVVVTLPGDGPLVAMVRERGAEVAFCPTVRLSKALLRPRGLLALVRHVVVDSVLGWRLLARVRPSVVYVNTLTIPGWLVLARLRRIPVLCHVHEAERSAPWLLRSALALPLVLADLVLANSRFAVDVLAGSVPRVAARARVVDNGVAGPPTRSSARAVLEEPVRLLYVGRLSERKGVDVAVRAVHVLRGRGTPARLDVVGAVFPGYEWYQAQLEELVAELGLVGSVHLHGFQDSVWPFADATDVVVIPSRTDEPFGNTAVEAVLCARPVVVSRSGGLLEATAGYRSAQTVPPDDPEAVADAVQRVVDSWDTYRADAWRDAEEAVSRHAPSLYRARVGELIGELVGDRAVGRSG